MSEYEDGWNVSVTRLGPGKGRIKLWKDHRAMVADLDQSAVKGLHAVINQLAWDYLDPLPEDSVEVRYIKNGAETPEGFEVHTGLSGTHHGAYAGMAYRCPRCASSEKPHERHGHTECPVCNQVIEDCCDGSC